jgi:hypothetical protein
VRIRLGNGIASRGAARSAHFAICSHDGENAAPRHYDVAPGVWIEDVFLGGPDGSYELAVHGPAGFVRRFSGRIETREDQAVSPLSARPIRKRVMQLA